MGQAISTEEQARREAARDAHPIHQEAADALGIACSTYKSWLSRNSGKMVVTGRSTLRNAEGEVVMEWEKTTSAREQRAQLVVEAIERITPVVLVPKIAFLKDIESDIVPWLIMGDGHIGLLCHEAETGTNFDIKIGTREVCAAASGLLDMAPRCRRIVVEDTGDFSHYENFAGVTEASGHLLDYDSRFPKMIDAIIDTMCFIIEAALKKADVVDFIASQGNHSRTNDIWMARLIRRLYGHTGRVNVLNNDSPIICYRQGKTLVLCHHGDKMKPPQLAGVMQADFAVDWGETEFRYIDGGHVHHSSKKELPGCRHESWNNLAPRDKYANDYGWRSKQSMSLVLRSRSYGELGRYTMPVERVRDMIRANPATADHYIPPVMRAFAA